MSEESDYILISNKPDKILKKIINYEHERLTAIDTCVEKTVMPDGRDFLLLIDNIIIDLYGGSIFSDFQESSLDNLLDELMADTEITFESMTFNPDKGYNIKLSADSIDFVIQAYWAVLSREKKIN